MPAEMIAGFHAVHESLRAGRRKILRIYLSRRKPDARMDILMRAAADGRAPVERVDAARLNALADGAEHQGVVAQAAVYPVLTLDQMLRQCDGRCSFLLLDCVTDPHNMGALIRSAYCAGIADVIIPKNRSCPPTPAVSRCSAGALEHVRLARVTNIVNAIAELQKYNIWALALAPDGDQSIYATDLSGRLAWVVGGEQKGVRPLVSRRCDWRLFIPQFGKIDSLNASVAGAVAMFEGMRQQQACRQPVR